MYNQKRVDVKITNESLVPFIMYHNHNQFIRIYVVRAGRYLKTEVGKVSIFLKILHKLSQKYRLDLRTRHLTITKRIILLALNLLERKRTQL